MIPNSTIFTWTIQAAETVTGVDADYICTEIRSARVCRARIAVFYHLHDIGWPAKRIAQFFHGNEGKKINISTVTYGIHRAKRLHAEDWSFDYLCNQIKSLVNVEKQSARNDPSISIGLRYSR